MEKNLRLFNQINSLSYWFLIESNYKSSVVFDAEKDSYFITVKKGNKALYSQRISHFSKKNKQFLKFELLSIVNSLLLIKDRVTKRHKHVA